MQKHRLTDEQVNQIKALAMLLGSIDDSDTYHKRKEKSVWENMQAKREKIGWYGWFDFNTKELASDLASAVKSMGAGVRVEKVDTEYTVFINWDH